MQKGLRRDVDLGVRDDDGENRSPDAEGITTRRSGRTDEQHARTAALMQKGLRRALFTQFG
jgi:hypothetical protein